MTIFSLFLHINASKEIHTWPKSVLLKDSSLQYLDSSMSNLIGLNLQGIKQLEGPRAV